MCNLKVDIDDEDLKDFLNVEFFAIVKEWIYGLKDKVSTWDAFKYVVEMV